MDFSKNFLGPKYIIPNSPIRFGIDIGGVIISKEERQNNNNNNNVFFWEISSFFNRKF